MYDRRANGRARVGRALSSSLAQSLSPTPESVQRVASESARRAKAAIDSSPLSGARALSLSVKAGTQTVAHGMGKAVSIVGSSGVSVTLVASDARTLTFKADKAGSAQIFVK